MSRSLSKTRLASATIIISLSLLFIVFLSQLSFAAQKSVTNAGPATFWIGLKNSDDQGTQFDLKAELYLNGVLVYEGVTLCTTGVTRNAALAKEVSVPLSPVSSGSGVTGDTLSLKVFTRIGSTPEGLKCSGPGGSHNNAVGLRLYYDSPDRQSRFGAQMSQEPSQSFFLHSSGANYYLDTAAPAGPVQYKDSTSINFSGGNLWKEIGAWNGTALPWVSITNLVDGQIFSSPNITVSGTVDPSKTTVLINGVSAVLTSGSYQGNVTLSYGLNTITVEARDASGNSTTAQVTVTMDNLQPVISIEPVEGFTSSPSVAISGSIEDITASTVAIQGKTVFIPAGGGNFSGMVDLTEGPNSLTLTASDSAGNTSSVSGQVTLDTSAPSLTVSTLSDNSWTNSGLLNISGIVTDNTGIQQLTVNGSVVTINPDGTFSYPINLTEGPNLIDITATDLAGNLATDIRTVNLDLSAPNIAITTPADNIKTRLPSVDITGTVDEQATVTVKVNASDPVPVPMNGSDFGLTAILTYGINTIEVTSTDRAGNTSSIKRTVTFDDQNPSLSVTDPAQDIKTNQSGMIIKGEAADLTAALVTISIDGNVYTPAITDGRFEQPIAFTTEKTYQIYVKAVDEAGNETTVQRNVVYDVTLPDVTLDPVTSSTNLGSQLLTGTMETGAAVAVTCPTAVISEVTYPTATTWAAAVADLQEGNNSIEIIATDEAGNRSLLVSIIITVDRNLPVITLDPSPEYTSNRSIEIKGTVTDLTATTVTAQGKTVSIPAGGGAFSIMIDLSEGPNTITVTAQDSAGNTSDASGSITLDTIDPVARITSPSAGQYIGKNFTAVSGTVSDATPTRVTINGMDAPVADGSFALSSVSLIEGSNTIRAIATDSAGNTGTDEINVISDTIQPSVIIDSPSSGLKTNIPTHNISGSITDSSPIASTTVNGAPVSLTSGRYAYPYTLIEGTNAITVRTTDMAGNEGSSSIIVTLDTISPSSPTIDPLPSVTNLLSIALTGTSEPDSRVKITGAGEAIADPSGRFSISVNLSPDTLNTFTVRAIDEVGNEGQPVTLSILQDSGAPSVTGFSLKADPKVTLLIPISITFSEEMDFSTVKSSNIKIQSQSALVEGTFSMSGTEVVFTPLAELPANQSFTLTVGSGIKDKAGNSLSPVFAGAFDTIRGPSFILGEVYDDTLGLPLEGAEVRVLRIRNSIPEPIPSLYTDAKGSFSFEYQGEAGEALLEIGKDGYTKAIRYASLLPNKSFSIFDVRLTPTKRQLIPASAGGGLSSGETILTILPLSLTRDTEMSLTVLSQQGSGSRLPLGWSPFYGIDISPWDSLLHAPATLSIRNVWSITDRSQFAVAYLGDNTTGWTAANAVLSGDNIMVEVINPGQYLLLVPDTFPAPPPVPSIAGEPILPSVTLVPDGGTATVEIVPPAVLSQKGAQGMTGVVVTTQNPVPSGTAIEAKVTEKYNLITGEVVSIEPFIQDITVYAWPEDGNSNTLSAYFPATPSRIYPLGSITYGEVNIDVFLPTAAGQPVDNVMGEQGGTVSSSDGTELIIPPSSLTAGTVISLYPLSQAELPAGSSQNLSLAGAFTLQMQGGSFRSGIFPQFSIPGLSAPEGTKVIMAKVVQMDGRNELAAAAIARVFAGKVIIEGCLTNLQSPISNNCIVSGSYAFYVPARPFGFVTGNVLKASLPVSGAIVSVDNLPFKSLSDASGGFVLISLAGNFAVNASEPATGQTASESGVIADSETKAVVLNLASRNLEILSVIPYDKATAVDLKTQIRVTFSGPADPLTVNSATFGIFKKPELISQSPIPVTGRASLTSQNTMAVFTPDAALTPNSIYTVKLTSDIKDTLGNSLVPFETVFTTAEVLNNDALAPGALKVSMPDAEGYVTVRGGTGLTYGGAIVLIINKTKNIVLTVIANNDGTFEGRIRADITDELVIEVRDLLGNITTMSPGLFMSDDGTAAVGPKGGTIYGPGGVKAVIPEGAFDQTIAVQVTMLPVDAIKDVRIHPELRKAGVIKVDMGNVTAKKELKISIPAPDWVTPDHQILLAKVINIRGFDELTLSCPAILKDGQIISTSPPFDGIVNTGSYALLSVNDINNGLGYAMVETWNTDHYFIMGAYDFVFPAIPYVYKTMPITLPVNQLYNLNLASLATGEVVKSVSIQGPPARGEFIQGTVDMKYDNMPPTVFTKSIHDGAVGILPTDNYISIEMSEPIDPKTVDRNTVTVRDSAGNIVEGDPYLAGDEKTIIFVPKYGYKYGTTYTIAINGVKDRGGNAITGYTSSFTTFNPHIIATIPLPSATAIDKYKNYIVAKGVEDTFSTFRIINIADPEHPEQAGSFNLYGNYKDLKVMPDSSFADRDGNVHTGDFLVTVGGKTSTTGYLSFMDITNPANVTIFEDIYLSYNPGYGEPPAGAPYAGGSPEEVAVLGTNAYVANLGFGLQAIDLTKVTPPNFTAQNSAIGGTILEPSYRGISKVRNNILATMNHTLSILSPQMQVISQITDLKFPYSVTGVEAFPIDLDNDRNYGPYEDNDGDATTAAQEAFDLALVSTSDGLVIIDVTDPQVPKKMDIVPIQTGKIAVDRDRRMAFGLSDGLVAISLKDLKPVDKPSLMGLRDSDGDGIDDRLLYRYPEASGIDMVLSQQNGLFMAYVADYTNGLVKVVHLNQGGIYVEREDREFPNVNLIWNDYYPALGKKNITIRASEGLDGKIVHCEDLNKLAICEPVEQEIKDGKAKFSLDGRNLAPPDSIKLQFALKENSEIQTTETYNVKNNSNTTLGEVLEGKAVFAYDADTEGNHKGITAANETDDGKKKFDFVQELLNQVVPRKRSVPVDFALIEEDGLYDAQTYAALFEFKDKFNGVNHFVGSYTPGPEGKGVYSNADNTSLTFRKLMKDYGKRQEGGRWLVDPSPGDSWLYKIIDKETLVGSTERTERLNSATRDSLVNDGNTVKDTGLYELYENVVQPFVEAMIEEAEKYSGDHPGPIAVDQLPTDNWRSRNNYGSAGCTSQTPPCAGEHGRGMSYCFGCRDTIEVFNRHVSSLQAPLSTKTSLQYYYNAQLQKLQAAKGESLDIVWSTTVPSTYRGDLNEGGVMKKYAGLYKWEYDAYPVYYYSNAVKDSANTHEYPQFTDPYWAGIECSGLTQESINAARATSPGLRIMIPVPSNRISSGMHFTDNRVLNMANPSDSQKRVELQRKLKKGDLVKYKGHISIVYSEKPTSCNNISCSYEIIHAYGHNTYARTNPQTGRRSRPEFSRKVIITGNDISVAATGFGRIKLWD